MNLFAGVSLVASLAVVAVDTGAASPLLEPTGKWTVDYAENMCVLQRSYGTATQPLILGFKPSPMSDDLRLIIIASGKGRGENFGPASVNFAGAAPTEGRFKATVSSSKSLRAIFVDVSRSALGPWDGTKSLTVRAGQQLNATFGFDNMAVARKGLDDCVTDLLKSWGMDEAVLASIAVPPAPIGTVGSYFRDEDYPDAAIRGNEHGASGVRFMVGTDGRARECKVVESSGSATLDEVTCRIVTARARFKPATDREGKPVASLSYTRITWALPGV